MQTQTKQHSSSSIGRRYPLPPPPPLAADEDKKTCAFNSPSSASSSGVGARVDGVDGGGGACVLTAGSDTDLVGAAAVRRSSASAVRLFNGDVKTSSSIRVASICFS